VLALAVLVGVSLTLWLCWSCALAYVLWRYVYKPWQIVRRDHHALHERLKDLEAKLEAQQRIIVRTEWDEAQIEQALRARRAAYR
jgi:hypothetical protein